MMGKRGSALHKADGGVYAFLGLRFVPLGKGNKEGPEVPHGQVTLESLTYG